MNIVFAVLGTLLPGLCWWVWTDQEDRDPIEIIARIIGISIGFIALAALFIYVIGLPVGPRTLIAYALGLGICFLVGLVKRTKLKFQPSWLAALLFIGIILAWRFWQARGLVLPNWVDSLHHSLIVRKMIEAGGLTSTLEPYLPGPFYYHYAFHSFTALFSHLSGIDPARSVLLVGQVLIASISLSAYSLTKALSRDWRAAAAAATFVTFLTKMPGYYLSWGRYTLVSGVLLLGLAMAEAIRFWRTSPTWKQGVGLTILVAGTLLSHYLAAFLLGLFVILRGVQWIVVSVRQRRWEWVRILKIVIPVLVAFLLVLPWYFRIFNYAGSAMNLNPLRTLENLTESRWTYTAYLIGPEVAYPMVALAGVGIFWSLTQTKLRVFGVWSLAIALLTLPLTLQITPFRSDYYALVLFLPVCVVASLFLFWLSDQLGVVFRQPVLAEAIAVGLVFCLLSTALAANVSAINPQTILVEPSDVRALDWINEHLPTDARFFINTTPWGYGVWRGVDGGAWILPYTGRWSLVPTIFYPFGMETNNTKLIIGWGEQAEIITACSNEFWQLVEEVDLDYAYLNQRSGNLQAAGMEDCLGTNRIYDSGGVSIWLLKHSD